MSIAGAVLRPRTIVGVAAVVALVITGIPTHSQGQAPTSCTFDKATASVWATRNEQGVVAYYGDAILFTKGCGENSPGDITVEFQPVAGQPSTCQPRTANYDADAVCTTALGTALPGTVITITAQGKRVGAQGGDVFFSQCSIILPNLENSSCGLPMESSPL